MQERPQITGEVTIQLFGPDGKLKDERKKKNTITNAGFDLICALLGNPTRPTQLTHIGIGWGTGANTAFAATQTDLQGANKDRNAATYAYTSGMKTFTLDATWGANDPSTSEAIIEESGCFNAASGGTMLNRVVFTGIAKQPADTLKITWTFTLS